MALALNRRRPLWPAFFSAALVLLLALAPALARAEEPSVQGLTLDEAIGRALAHSLSLKAANLEVEKKEALREQAAEAVTFTPVQGASYDPSFEVKWYGLLSADLQWQMSKKSYAAAEDALVLQTCQKYWGVLAAGQQVEVARLALECAETAARNARLAAQVGSASRADAVSAEARLEQAKRSLAAAEAALGSAYEEFNQLVGLRPEERPALVDRPQYSPVEVASIEHEVSRVLEASPAVWQAEQGRALAEWNLWMAYAGGSYQPYEARRKEVEKAEVSAAQARQAAEQVVRSLYSSLRALEERYAAQEQQVAEKQEKLRVTEAKFAVGMVTRADVQAAELELAQARAALDDLVRQHAYYKLAFQKPWAMGGSSAGGSSSSGTSASSGSSR